jgi:hypothetical protein
MIHYLYNLLKYGSIYNPREKLKRKCIEYLDDDTEGWVFIKIKSLNYNAEGDVDIDYFHMVKMNEESLKAMPFISENLMDQYQGRYFLEESKELVKNKKEGKR